MTLSVRNNFFRGGICISVLSLVLICLGGYLSYSGFSEAASSAILRSGGVIQNLITRSIPPSDMVPFIVMVFSAVYSLVSIFLIFFNFEKTQAPEILFIAFFVLSLSFEITRIMLPLQLIHSFPVLYVTFSARILLFARYFGIFSLFAAGVYAAGLDIQNQLNAFFLMVLASLVIAVNIPVNALVWDSSFKMMNGYGSMLSMVEIGVIIITIITFFISAYTRGANTFVLVGIGVFMIFIGRNILITSDNYLSMALGVLLLTAGTCLTVIKLHKEYLWS